MSAVENKIALIKTQTLMYKNEMKKAKREKVGFEYYAVSVGGKIASQSKAMMRCTSCRTEELKTIYNFCPNCGGKFEREEVKEITDPQTGQNVDLFI